MKKKSHMKLKSKMMVLFLTIILVPLGCAAIVFFGFGYYENIDVLRELSKEDIMIGAMINRRLMECLVIALSLIHI